MNQQQEKQEYINSLKNFSDRELLELQTYFSRKQTDYLKSIDGRLFILLAIIVLGTAISLIISSQ